MRVLKKHEINPQPSKRDIFTGNVSAQMVVDSSMAKQFQLNLVKFSAGGRTTWHTHTFEQGLISIEGKGIVATEAEEQVVEP